MIVDEAGMLDQDTARALLTVADECQVRVALLGDRHQLSAVGRGGVLDLAIGKADPAATLTLDAVHRFTRTDEDGRTTPDTTYAELTLAMRTGEDPGAVFDALLARGQIQLFPDAAALREALAGTAASSYAAGRLVAVVVDTREQAAELNTAIRERLIVAGRVDDRTVAVTGTGQRIGAGDRIATLVSLSLTPLTITDGLRRWDGLGERVPAEGTAILFGRSIAARLPDDLSDDLALMVMDVCGAPALVDRVVREQQAAGTGTDAPTVCVLGGAGKSGSLSLAAARAAGAGRLIGVVPTETEAEALRASGLADAVAVVDARSPIELPAAVQAAGGPADLTVVCVDVPGCEQPAVLATAQGGSIIYFSMATDFAAAALGAEGLAADVRMIVGNGYTPGHADLALDLVRSVPTVRELFEARLRAEG